MKTVLFALALLSCECRIATAGDLAFSDSRNAMEPHPLPPDEDGWQLTLTPYGWLANLDGTLGVRGYTTPVDIKFDDILNNLDMVALINMEARKGRWGGWIDFAYLDVSVGGNPAGPLFDSIGIGLESVLAEAAVFYRVLDGDRGVMDLYAGARYYHLGGAIELNVSEQGLREVSRELSQTIVDQLLAAVSAQVEPALSSAASQTAEKLAADARNALSESVSEKASEAESKINNLREIAAAHPVLADKLRNSAALKEALEGLASAQLEAKRLELEQKAEDVSALTQKLRAAAERAKDKAEKAVAKAEKRLADKIEDALSRGIPEEISGSYDWVDPFVGLRARYNFTDRLYAVGKADIGGFGVSSDLVWNVYGALGYHLTKSGNTTLELGYRHMAVDYTSGDFIFNTNMSGAMVSLGFKF